MAQIRHLFLWVGFGLLVGNAACSLPFEAQTACLDPGDCLTGYACVSHVCVQAGAGAQIEGGGTDGGGTGNTNGTGTGGTAGNTNWAAITPVSSDSLVTCADVNALSTWNHSNGPATHLSFVIQPVDDAVGAALCPVAVAALDDAGAIVTNHTGSVTLSAATGGLGGGITASAVNGVAVFPALHMSSTGIGQILTATQGAMQAQSNTFKTHAVSWTQVGSWGWTSNIFYNASRGSIYAYNHTGDFSSSDGGASWQSLTTTGRLPVGSLQSPEALFAWNDGPALSVDGGNTYTNVCGNLDTTTCSALAPRAVDTVSGALLAADNQHMYVSRDRGATWTMIIDIGSANAYFGFAATAASNNVLYTAQAQSHAIIVSDGLTANYATYAVTPASPNSVISSIAVDPRDANVVYVAATDGLFVSHDRGATYAQPISGCASVVAAAAAVGSASTQVYAVLNDCFTPTPWNSPTPGYVGSIDGGATWQNAAWGLQPVDPTYYGDYTGAGPTACDTSIAADPSGNGSVYVSLGWCGGVYHSASGGVN